MSDPLEDLARESERNAPPKPLTAREHQELVKRRQNGRAIVMAVLLGAFVVLVFAITIAKMKHGGQ